jgi:hypothetical protein
MRSGKCAEEISRRIAYIRPAINDQRWLADIEQASICLRHEDLLEDIEVTRPVAEIDRCSAVATAQGELSSVDCGETQAAQQRQVAKLRDIQGHAPGPDLTVEFQDSDELGSDRHELGVYQPGTDQQDNVPI